MNSTCVPRRRGRSVRQNITMNAEKQDRFVARALDDDSRDAARDIADVTAVELISTVGVHLLSAAALRCGLAEDGDEHRDLDEARKLINALAGLITAAVPDLGDTHARALRDGLRSVQLAFREASVVQDPPGEGPGEKYTGAVG